MASGVHSQLRSVRSVGIALLLFYFFWRYVLKGNQNRGSFISSSVVMAASTESPALSVSGESSAVSATSTLRFLAPRLEVPFGRHNRKIPRHKDGMNIA
ncbi:hypothetical protein predicted by Glimmer/Critica [Bordetella petrii]|uniref:Uncharacterized protein n=1 Tax=Bordetella petrii (strain ATCC BAA-461 / DSM 12804 / CCUG 43448 / CIP 107267 / Se-1111R) TaxID=340100 RepID=A9ICA1_BORPD|nr:hypothetical protein predicted by Glimmer/Critica [Bordetella petrii]